MAAGAMRRLCCDIRIWGDPAHRGGRLRRFFPRWNTCGRPFEVPKRSSTHHAICERKYSVTGHPFTRRWATGGAVSASFPDAENACMLFRSSLFSRSGRRAFAAATQTAGGAASSAGGAALLRHGAGAGARCVDAGRLRRDARCERIIPPFGFIRRWALLRAAFCRSASYGIHFGLKNCRRVIIET